MRRWWIHLPKGAQDCDFFSATAYDQKRGDVAVIEAAPILATLENLVNAVESEIADSGGASSAAIDSALGLANEALKRTGVM